MSAVHSFQVGDAVHFPPWDQATRLVVTCVHSSGHVDADAPRAGAPFYVRKVPAYDLAFIGRATRAEQYAVGLSPEPESAAELTVTVTPEDLRFVRALAWAYQFGMSPSNSSAVQSSAVALIDRLNKAGVEVP